MLKMNSRNNFSKLAKNITSNLEDTMTDVLLDISRVSSQAAPHKSGKLEKSYKYTQKQNGANLVGEILYEARNSDGDDYAVQMHESTYKLGEGSQRKPGGKSKYGSGTIKVGPEFLKRTLEDGEEGYTKAFEDTIKEAIEKNKA